METICDSTPAGSQVQHLACQCYLERHARGFHEVLCKELGQSIIDCITSNVGMVCRQHEVVEQALVHGQEGYRQQRCTQVDHELRAVWTHRNCRPRRRTHVGSHTQHHHTGILQQLQYVDACCRGCYVSSCTGTNQPGEVSTAPLTLLPRNASADCRSEHRKSVVMSVGVSTCLVGIGSKHSVTTWDAVGVFDFVVSTKAGGESGDGVACRTCTL